MIFRHSSGEHGHWPWFPVPGNTIDWTAYELDTFRGLIGILFRKTMSFLGLLVIFAVAPI